MKYKIFALWGIALVWVITQPGYGAVQQEGFGLGIIVGEPTGLSGKLWMSEHTALVGGAAWSFGREEEALHLHLDYLHHNFEVIKVDKGQLPIYYGIGGRLKLEDDSRIGLRLPVGLNYIFEQAPLDLFMEIVPILELVPETEFNLNGGIGIRYFF